MLKDLDITKLSDAWQYDIIPLLEEYFFEEKDELEAFTKIYQEKFESPTS